MCRILQVCVVSSIRISLEFIRFLLLDILMNSEKHAKVDVLSLLYGIFHTASHPLQSVLLVPCFHVGNLGLYNFISIPITKTYQFVRSLVSYFCRL